MNSVKINCPSCFRSEMVELDFSGHASTCLHCSYVMYNITFLRSLVGDPSLKVESVNYQFLVSDSDSPQGLSCLAKIRTVSEGPTLVDCANLNRIVPMVKNLQLLWPELELNVIGGVTTHLNKCPLCGVRDYEVDKKGIVKCRNCKKLTVSIETFVFSQVVEKMGLTCFVENGFLKLFKTTFVHPKWWQIFTETKTLSTSVFTLQLRPKEVHGVVSGYILAVEVAEDVDLLEKSQIVTKIRECIGLSEVMVMEDLRVVF